MANPLKSVKLIGRKIGRSMLQMNKKERTRKRKAERYFGKEERMVGNQGEKEKILPEEPQQKVDVEEVFEDSNEEIF